MANNSRDYLTMKAGDSKRDGEHRVRVCAFVDVDKAIQLVKAEYGKEAGRNVKATLRLLRIVKKEFGKRASVTIDDNIHTLDVDFMFAN